MLKIDADILGHILYMTGGALVSLIGAYFVVGRDLAFVKGQLSQLVHALHRVDEVANRVSILEKAHVSHASDLNQAFKKLRELGGEDDPEANNHDQ